MNKYVLVILAVVVPQAFAADSASNWYNCSHSNLPNSAQACDAIVAASDYDSMVKLCSAGTVFSGQKGTIDFCGILSRATGPEVALAIGNNSNSKGVQLGYSCAHPAHNPGSSQACLLVEQGAAAGNYDAAFSAVQLCASGGYDTQCTALNKAGDNANVIQAIGDNSDKKGVQLGYSCSHPAHNPGATQSCALVVQGAAAGNYDAAFSAVQLCAAGGYDALCDAVAKAANNANVVKAIGDNANGKGVQLGYSCMHPTTSPGSKQSCTLLAQGVVGDNYDAAFSAVQACSAGGNDALCAAVASAGTNANVVKAIGDNANGKGVQLGYVCLHPTTSPGSKQACALLAQGTSGHSYDAAFSAVQACAASGNDDLCAVIAKAGSHAHVIKAIGDNSNSKGVQLGYRCLHSNLPGASQSCVLLEQGASGGSYDAAFSAVQVCASGTNDALCAAVAKAGTNANVVKAIGDNSNGKGVQLGYSCMHNNPGASESCTLLAQGVAGNNGDAAISAVQVCAAGSNDALCTAISKAASSSGVSAAINANVTGGVNLQYACSHTGQAGSSESCALLALVNGSAGSPVVSTVVAGSTGGAAAAGDSGAAISYDSAVMWVQNCANGVADDSCAAVAKAGNNANVLKAISDNINGNSVSLSYNCSHGGSASCLLISQAVAGGDSASVAAAQQLCATGAAPSLCAASTNSAAVTAPVAPPATVPAVAPVVVPTTAPATPPVAASAGLSADAANTLVQNCANGVDSTSCAAVASAGSDPNILKAISDNINGNSVSLSYNCSHGGSASCLLISQAVAGGDSASVAAAQQLCATGAAPSLCVAPPSSPASVTPPATVPAVAPATPPAAASPGLSADVANTLVQNCANGVDSTSCAAVASAGSDPNILKAIDDNINGNSVSLSYNCSHGGTTSCSLLAQGAKYGNADSVAAVQQLTAQGITVS